MLIEISEDVWQDIVYNQGLYSALEGMTPRNRTDRDIQKLAKLYTELVEYLKKNKVEDGISNE